MTKNSVSRRISLELDAKIRQYRVRAKKLFGMNISYVQASQILTKDIK